LCFQQQSVVYYSDDRNAVRTYIEKTHVKKGKTAGASGIIATRARRETRVRKIMSALITYREDHFGAFSQRHSLVPVTFSNCSFETYVLQHDTCTYALRNGTQLVKPTTRTKRKQVNEKHTQAIDAES